MTPQELEAALRKLEAEERERVAREGSLDGPWVDFNAWFGGGQKSVEERVAEFVANPEFERKLAHRFGLKTEEEKRVEAAMASAAAAKLAATAAVVSTFVALVALFGRSCPS